MTEQPTAKPEAAPPKPLEDVPPIEKYHQLTLKDKTLRYTTSTGMMPLKNAETGEIEAQIFYMSYKLETSEPAAKRPLIFVFNGGPGSSSVWLHLGALGPKRVKMQDAGWMPAPPYRLVDNEQTWLDLADLVFIDPVGTGYSRAARPDLNEKYWNVKGDLEAVGEFIRMYLTRYQRWASPLFLTGESYGTTRAAGLTGHLFDKGIAFNGVVLVSTTLNFQTLRFDRGNDMPYALFVPTYAATAWYHHKLPADLQSKPLTDVLAEVEAWAENEYTVALAKGDKLSAAERRRILKRLARYTGLDTRHIEHSNLRVLIHRFCKELLRDSRRTVGRLDSRFKGIDTLPVTEFPDFDPSLTAIMPPYTAMINDYVRGELGYKTDTSYEVLSLTVNEAWKNDEMKYPDTSEALRSAFARNPFMKVFVAQGYYDLATPHLAAQYTFNHMDIDPDLRQNFQFAYYEAGHMLYLDVNCLAKLKDDVTGFLNMAIGG